MDPEIIGDSSERTAEGIIHGTIAGSVTFLAEYLEHHKCGVVLIGVAVSFMIYLRFRRRRKERERRRRRQKYITNPHHKF